VGNTFGQSVHMRCHNQQSIPTADLPFEMDAETTNSGWRIHYRKDWRFARSWYGMVLSRGSGKYTISIQDGSMQQMEYQL